MDESKIEKNKEKARARAKAWALANPERRRKVAKLYRETNKEKLTLGKKAWYAANKERAIETALRSRLRGRAKLIAGLPEICSICGATESGRKGKKIRLAVDHCHTTGRIRGLLCHRCNVLLGLAKDDLGILKSAAGYLEGADHVL